MGHIGSSLEKVLSYDGRKEIEKGFINWKRKCDPRLKKVLKKYGLECEQAKNCHYHIGFPGFKEFITVSSTPGDTNSLNNAAHDLINYIEKFYREYQKRTLQR